MILRSGNGDATLSETGHFIELACPVSEQSRPNGMLNDV